MKKVLFLVLFFSTMIFAKESVLVNTIKNVSIPNVENAINDAKILQKDVNAQNFTNFLKSWKKVEALYFVNLQLLNPKLQHLNLFLFLKYHYL